MKLPEEFIHTLLFMTRKAAQRILDRKYPGWYVRLDADGTTRIYDSQRQLQHTIHSAKKLP